MNSRSSADTCYQVLAIDIEASGSSFSKNGIVSIGASLQDQASNELDFFQVNLALANNRVYDEFCFQEFWLKNREIYNFVQDNALPPQEAMKIFCIFLQK